MPANSPCACGNGKDKRLKLRARAPLQTLRRCRWYDSQRKRKRAGSSVGLSVQPSPPLSRTLQPLFPCWNIAAASIRKPHETKHENKSRELSSALALRLPLAPTAFIQGSIKFFWQTSIRQSPREINALTSLMPCSAQFCSAEPPSSVLCYLRRAWGRRESNSTILHRGLHKVLVHVTATLAMVDTLQEEGAVIRLTVSNMSIFMCLCVQAQPTWGKEAAVWLCCIVSIKCDRGRVF